MTLATRRWSGREEPDWAEWRRRLRNTPPDLKLHLVELRDVSRWASQAVGWLSESELARARDLRDETARREFLESRVILRRLLALRLGCEPEAVDLPRDSAGGAPAPARPRTGEGGAGARRVHYSLARTPGYVAVLIGNRAVGVDVERRQSPAQADSLLRVLHAADRARLANEPERRRPRAVTDAWVRLEALLKALGTGLSIDPSTVSVGAAPRVRHSDGLIVMGVRTRRGSRLHVAVAWLEDPEGIRELTVGG